MGRGSEQTFFQGSHTHGQWAHEKMLNITNQKGNADQNHNEIITSQLSEWLFLKLTDNMNWQGYWEKGNLVHYWQGCKLEQPLWKTVGDPPEN